VSDFWNDRFGIGFRIRFRPQVHRHRQDVLTVRLDERRAMIGKGRYFRPRWNLALPDLGICFAFSLWRPFRARRWVLPSIPGVETPG
ncbi:MAG: hypothetical protein WB586_29695, partial [Chthoniobacterales bacterium]